MFCTERYPTFCTESYPAFCTESYPSFCTESYAVFCTESYAAFCTESYPAFCTESYPAFCTESYAAFCTELRRCEINHWFTLAKSVASAIPLRTFLQPCPFFTSPILSTRSGRMHSPLVAEKLKFSARYVKADKRRPKT